MSGDSNPVVRLVGTYGRPYLPHFATAVVGILLARLFWFFPPIVVGVLFDAVLIGDTPYRLPGVPGSLIPAGRIEQFWFSVGVITAVYVLGYATFLVGMWLRSIAAYRVQHRLRTDAYEHTQRLGFEFFDRKDKGEVISILNNDVNQLERFFNSTFQLVGDSLFVLVAIVGYMLLLNWQLALVSFVAPTLVAVFNYGYSRHVDPKYQAMRSSVGDISSRIENNVSGIGVIKAYTREDFERSRIEDLSREYRDVSWTVARARIGLTRVTNLLGNLGYITVLTVGGLWVLSGPGFAVFSGDLAAGVLLSFMIYNERFNWPLSQITTIVDRYQEAKASSRRVFGLLDREPEIENPADAVELDVTTPSVSFDRVTFRYGDGEAAVEDVDVTVPGGETVGIVGPTGAGKSTLLKLLFRFYDPDSGTVRIEGTDVRDVDRRSYRDHIGYVSQDPYLFAGSVEENIAYGGADPSHEAVVAAAKTASAHEFVTELDGGYDAPVGEGGSRLSGGQRQRIAIARAVVGDPEILILDEATSHVDNATEVVLQRSLEEITSERTTFVVAHNLSSVRNADEILVLEDGRVTERGIHEELVAGENLYADLWRIQIGDFENVSDISRLEGTV